MWGVHYPTIDVYNKRKERDDNKYQRESEALPSLWLP